MATEKEKNIIRERLLENGAKNLCEFGYTGVKASDILKAPILRAFFEGMLEDNLGRGEATDVVINELLAEIKAANEKEKD